MTPSDAIEISMNAIEPMTEVNPWELVKDKEVSELVFSYEAVLTEMRTWARHPSNRQIKEWVDRLDFARDEFVRAALSGGSPRE